LQNVCPQGVETGRQNKRKQRAHSKSAISKGGCFKEIVEGANALERVLEGTRRFSVIEVEVAGGETGVDGELFFSISSTGMLPNCKVLDRT
jgi:hypothetical protein